MSDPEPQQQATLTGQEASELRSALAELQDAVQELREARTAGERSDARESVQEAKGDLDAVARQLGISRETLERAAREAQQSERKNELRPILRDLLAEIERERAEAADGEEQDEEDADAAAGKAKPRRKAKPQQEASAPAPDSAPATEHWSERSLGELVR